MAEVVSSLDALVQMRRWPGLRTRVQERLLGVLEAALQMHAVPGAIVNRGAPLVMRVDDYEVTYSLDLESEAVNVLAVESAEDGRPPADGLSSLRLLKGTRSRPAS